MKRKPLNLKPLNIPEKDISYFSDRQTYKIKSKQVIKILSAGIMKNIPEIWLGSTGDIISDISEIISKYDIGNVIEISPIITERQLQVGINYLNIITYGETLSWDRFFAPILNFIYNSQKNILILCKNGKNFSCVSGASFMMHVLNFDIGQSLDYVRHFKPNMNIDLNSCLDLHNLEHNKNCDLIYENSRKCLFHRTS